MKISINKGIYRAGAGGRSRAHDGTGVGKARQKETIAPATNVAADVRIIAGRRHDKR
jgi:hypothetical protein